MYQKIKVKKNYRDSIFVNWRCFNSKPKPLVDSSSNACDKFVCVPFSVLIKWFRVFEKLEWKFDWLMSELGLISGCGLYKWLLSWESGVNVGYWIFWCIDMLAGDEVVITLDIVLNGFIPDTTGRRLGTEDYRKISLNWNRIENSSQLTSIVCVACWGCEWW